MKTLLIIALMMFTLTLQAQEKNGQKDIPAAKQVLKIMNEQILQLTDRFKKNTLAFKGQYEQQTKQILTGFKKRLQVLKQEISSIDENLEDLNLQLEQQSKENDKALQDQFKKLQSDLDDAMKRFEKKLDSLSQQY